MEFMPTRPLCAVATVPDVLNRARDASERASFMAKRVELRSDNMRSNISYVRKLIEDTKAKAASVSLLNAYFRAFQHACCMICNG